MDVEKEDKYKLMAFEIRCYRRILNVLGLWQKGLRVKKIRKGMVIEQMEEKLKLFGQIRRMEDNRLVKEVMFGAWAETYWGMGDSSTKSEVGTANASVPPIF